MSVAAVAVAERPIGWKIARGLANGTTPRWTPEQDAVLRDLYPSQGRHAVAAATGKSWRAVCERARRLKVRCKPQWTAAEDRKLSMLWGELPLAKVAKEMSRTPLSCYQRAKIIGLKRGVLEGMESVRAAAKRTGFDWATLVRILRAHGVRPQRTMSLDTKKGLFRRVAVDPMDVDEAIEAWNATELVTQAAQRRDLDHDTLGRWLEASGIEMPPRPGKFRHWRVPTEIIDRVVAQRRGRETVTAAARRLGIDRFLLSKMLKTAGVPRGDGHYWRVESTVIDRVVAEARERQPNLRRTA